MKNYVQMRKILLGGAAVGMFMVPALAQDQMETVTVTGIRASLQSAQAIKQNANQVVDSITSVDIGALPDRNVAEALQRVPGVTLQRTDTTNDLVRLGSIGNAVFIRGLAWVKSLVNGRDEFTAVAGRSLSFGDVSADLLQAVNVYKSPTASQIEGGVGGTVDLITRKPFDHDGQVIAVSGDYTYGDLIDVGLPSGNALYSNRWNTHIGEIGVLASVDWQEITNRTNGINIGPYSCWDVHHLTGTADAYAPKDTGYAGCQALTLGTDRIVGPQGWAWRQMEWKQQRLASNLVLQWRPSDKLEFTLFAMNTFAHNLDMEHYDYSTINLAQAQAGTLKNSVWTAGSSTLTSIDARGGSGHNRDTDISLNVKYNPTDKLEITLDLQAVESDSPYRNMTYYTSPLSGISTGLNVADRNNWKISYVDQPSNSAASNYIFPAAMDHLQYNSAHSGNARIDATYKFDGAGVFGLIKSAEAGFRTEQKQAFSRSSTWNWQFVQEGWLSPTNSYVTLDGTIHNGPWHGADGTTYATSTGGLATAINQAQLFHYQKILGNTLPALWAPKASLAAMNTIQSNALMKPYELNYAYMQSWATPSDLTKGNWSQWESIAAYNGCTGDDITCLSAYNGSSATKSKQNEQTYSGYFQLNYAYETLFGMNVPFEGNLGLRYVRTNDSVSAGYLFMPTLQNVVCNVGPNAGQSSSCADWNTAVAFLGGVANAGQTVVRPAVKSGYTNYLPSFNFAAHPTDNTVVRLAYSETILRPDFAYTYSSANLSFSFYGSTTNQYGIFNGDSTGIGGNPYLKPMHSSNYDASYEWYFSPTGSVTVSGFFKHLSNYIYSASTLLPVTSPAGHTMNFMYTTYVNGDKGKVGGFELAYQQFYDSLPGAWSGIGFQANYTHIWNQGGHNTGSDMTNPVAIAAANDKSLPLEGMSNDTYNLALLYNKYGIDARVAWNWRSMYLSSSSDANNKIPTWLEAYGQLDASVFYSFLDHYKIGTQVTNILALPFHSDNGYANFHPRGNTIETDRKFAIVLRASW